MDKRFHNLVNQNAQALSESRQRERIGDQDVTYRYIERLLLNIYNTLIDTNTQEALAIDPKILRSMNQLLSSLLIVQNSKKPDVAQDPDADT